VKPGAALLAFAMLLAAAAPALGATINCESPDRSAIIELDVDFAADRQSGSVTRVRIETDVLVMSTVAGETDFAPETIAYDSVAHDRIETGLESPNIGPLTFRLDIVRTADYQPDEEEDTDAVVAGVAYVRSAGTVTVICSGW
jgi:hypothetical protein